MSAVVLLVFFAVIAALGGAINAYKHGNILAAKWAVASLIWAIAYLVAMLK